MTPGLTLGAVSRGMARAKLTTTSEATGVQQASLLTRVGRSAQAPLVGVDRVGEHREHEQRQRARHDDDFLQQRFSDPEHRLGQVIKPSSAR